MNRFIIACLFFSLQVATLTGAIRKSYRIGFIDNAVHGSHFHVFSIVLWFAEVALGTRYIGAFATHDTQWNRAHDVTLYEGTTELFAVFFDCVSLVSLDCCRSLSFSGQPAWRMPLERVKSIDLLL